MQRKRRHGGVGDRKLQRDGTRPFFHQDWSSIRSSNKFNFFSVPPIDTKTETVPNPNFSTFLIRVFGRIFVFNARGWGITDLMEVQASAYNFVALLLWSSCFRLGLHRL
ncbi:hypothetical protein CKAN_00957300 [Cinnamomum micranthum f. kanehirae]|uniref:Uncharacterized protein n=1 Tax=Cinnamomum micranthum f. kanehirae TaxID=337451 RepID=A0A443NQZ0_9MAGN|nr:hypothetical protein CKAN_00957300 [Cinnamomum micranthum f. kanehirae]